MNQAKEVDKHRKWCEENFKVILKPDRDEISFEYGHDFTRQTSGFYLYPSEARQLADAIYKYLAEHPEQ